MKIREIYKDVLSKYEVIWKHVKGILYLYMYLYHFIYLSASYFIFDWSTFTIVRT